jgi:hypothetical protein
MDFPSDEWTDERRDGAAALQPMTLCASASSKSGGACAALVFMQIAAIPAGELKHSSAPWVPDLSRSMQHKPELSAMKRHFDPPLFIVTSAALVAFLLAVVGSSLLTTRASAGALDGVTGPVNEITAPVQEVVEMVAPPVVTAPPPPAAEPPPVVKIPEASIPEVPGKLPALKVPEVQVKPPSVAAPSVPVTIETAKRTIEAETAGAVAQAGEAATSVTAQAGGEVQKAAATAGGEAQRATGSGTLGSGGSTPASATSPAAGRPTAGQPVRADGSDVLAAVPLLRPFIYVWPAIALVTAGQLSGFLQGWSHLALALYQGGDHGLAPGSVGVGRAAQAAAGGSPSTAPLPFPDLNPGGGGISNLLVLLFVIPFALAAFTMAFRHEEGLPVLPRRLTRWWR